MTKTTTTLPAFAIFHHRFFLGYVSAVNYSDAVRRAKRLHPGKRLEVEVPINRKATPSQKLAANMAYNSKRAL